MKKSELENGMIITTRNGYEYLVLKDTCFFESAVGVSFKNACWLDLSDAFYDENLKNTFDDVDKCRENDIVKVEKPTHPLFIVPSVAKRLKEKIEPYTIQRILVWELEESESEYSEELEEEY